MSLSVNVQGGTGAGNRRVHEHEPWECLCPGKLVADGVWTSREHPGHRYSCPDCGERRPTATNH